MLVGADRVEDELAVGRVLGTDERGELIRLAERAGGDEGAGGVVAVPGGAPGAGGGLGELILDVVQVGGGGSGDGVEEILGVGALLRPEVAALPSARSGSGCSSRTAGRKSEDAGALPVVPRLADQPARLPLRQCGRPRLGLPLEHRTHRTPRRSVRVPRSADGPVRPRRFLRRRVLPDRSERVGRRPGARGRPQAACEPVATHSAIGSRSRPAWRREATGDPDHRHHLCELGHRRHRGREPRCRQGSGGRRRPEPRTHESRRRTDRRDPFPRRLRPPRRCPGARRRPPRAVRDHRRPRQQRRRS